MAYQRVGFVCGLAAIPMQGFTGMVLFVTDPRDFGNSSQGVRKVIEDAGSYRKRLPSLGVRWQHA